MFIDHEWRAIWFTKEKIGSFVCPQIIELETSGVGFSSNRTMMTLDSYAGDATAFCQLLSSREVVEIIGKHTIVTKDEDAEKLRGYLMLAKRLEDTLNFLRNYAKDSGHQDKRSRYILESFVLQGYDEMAPKDGEDFNKFSPNDVLSKTAIDIINDIASASFKLLDRIQSRNIGKIMNGIADRCRQQEYATYLQAHTLAKLVK